MKTKQTYLATKSKTAMNVLYKTYLCGPTLGEVVRIGITGSHGMEGRYNICECAMLRGARDLQMEFNLLIKWLIRKVQWLCPELSLTILKLRKGRK